MSEKAQQAPEKEIKRRFQLWLKPSVLDMAEELYESDNCISRSEFIEKAVKFYAGYLYSQRSQDYLPRVVTSTIKGITAESTNQISRILFKMAVEQAITMNVVAATCGISREQLDKLRATCVSQVKKTNGSYSFEDAYNLQKR
ncbi:MAG: hypothetical protein IJZ39_08015 [Oscillospiraceae bacterium]|nr:hypothetical protein [Oscillospiraceae bacterium]